MNKNIQVIAFDADDTLWVNEPYFQDAQERFGEICKEWIDPKAVVEEHYKTEINNIPVFGYGIKGFTISLIETAIRISGHRVSASQIEDIIQIGKSMLNHPIELLPEVEETLARLAPHYRLIVATKGDLLDQERKLHRSGIAGNFHHVEVMSEKNPSAYLKLIRHLDVPPEAFLMVGNSLRSDIIPVLDIGGNAFHIPYHIDWVHEKVETFNPPTGKFLEAKKLSDVCHFLGM